MCAGQTRHRAEQNSKASRNACRDRRGRRSTGRFEVWPGDLGSWSGPVLGKLLKTPSFPTLELIWTRQTGFRLHSCDPTLVPSLDLLLCYLPEGI